MCGWLLVGAAYARAILKMCVQAGARAQQYSLPNRLACPSKNAKAKHQATLIQHTTDRPSDATSDRRVQSVQSGVAFPTDGISQFSRWRAALARAVTFCRNYNNSPHTLEIRIESKPYNFTYHSQFSASEVWTTWLSTHSQRRHEKFTANYRERVHSPHRSQPSNPEENSVYLWCVWTLHAIATWPNSKATTGEQCATINFNLVSKLATD